MQRLLYYPLVNPPMPIVWQGLLYWDGIASITPHGGDHVQPLLRELRDTALYEPFDADSFKLWDPQRHDAMLRELEAVIGEIPGEELEPEPGPLHGGNRLYYGKLPVSFQEDLVAIGAAQPAGPAMQVNPRLLLAILAVTAKHLAQAYADEATAYLPHTDWSRAHRIAFGPLTQAGGSQRCWRVELGAALPVPAADTPLQKVLEFRDDYQDERTRLRIALHHLLRELQDIDDPDLARAAVKQEIAEAVSDLAAALRGRKLAWVKHGLWGLVALGAAAGAAHLGPEMGWPLAVTSNVAINLATSLTRNRVPGEFAYLHDLHRTFPNAAPAS
jgi:Family of unknown function (DUF6236)